NGINWTVYVNGVDRGTFQQPITIPSSLLVIGNTCTELTGDPYYVYTFEGNITNFRYVLGRAVYTDNFIPPTGPLTAIAGTELLLPNKYDWQ
ncbi:hypothetical protein EBR43_10105, partial [bacterium]|nr:hypothetical protein [bacterium]